MRSFLDVTGLVIAFRWAHLAASLALVGAVVIPLVAGRSDRPTALAWHARVRGLARGSALVAIVTALAGFATLVVTLEGGRHALGDGAALARVMLDTNVGVVWLVRASLLLVLVAFFALSPPIVTRADWIATRGEAALLSGLALALVAVASHASAIEPATARAIAVDATHLVAAGVWLGGLIPVAWLLRAASRPTGEDARAYAVLATRRFSRVALAAVIALVATGLGNTAAQVGSVPALLGTPYGHLLLAKLALVTPLIAIGAINRRRWLPALSGEAETIGRPTMRRLVAFIVVESAVACFLLLVVAAMSSTPPARHTEPTWPLGVRLTWDAIAGRPAALTRVFVASQIAVLGLVAAAAAAFCARGRRRLVITGAAFVVIGAAGALPRLAVDAYPTTFRRPAVPYAATSIAAGLALWDSRCARCHGADGAGGGPDARALRRPVADLRGRRTAEHTAGDLFWWISHGIPQAGMPAFDPDLTEEQRWDLVNVVRTLAAAPVAAKLGPSVSDVPSLVAPDFSFAVGPATPQTLRGFRDRKIVLLVLYRLPGSRARLGQLADADRLLTLLGVEIIAVPTDGAHDAIARLGPTPRALFSIVTSGAGDIVRAYRVFAATPHAEFLIDRQGYLRARWAAADGATREPNLLLAEVQQLNEETPTAPAPDEHVH